MRVPIRPRTASKKNDFFRPYFSLNQGAILDELGQGAARSTYHTTKHDTCCTESGTSTLLARRERGSGDTSLRVGDSQTTELVVEVGRTLTVSDVNKLRPSQFTKMKPHHPLSYCLSAMKQTSGRHLHRKRELQGNRGKRRKPTWASTVSSDPYRFTKSTCKFGIDVRFHVCRFVEKFEVSERVRNVKAQLSFL